ncbi:hypothetical protein FOA52_002923 [Chlamydomonas sp. UWO 241]|nr:hypothetical protein FOA52_002923 [Chlamydomonas sp. UWO 241]
MRCHAGPDARGALSRPRQLRTLLDVQSVHRDIRAAAEGRMSQNVSNANFPTTADGCTYHLGTKRGQVANRILTVGSVARAEMLTKLLTPLAPGMSHPLTVLSSRGFLTSTGLYNGVPVSIVSHLMGMPNMDFMVRECRAVVSGTMAVVRLGTCGALQRPAKLGDLLVASKGCINVRRNPDAWTLGNGTPPYTSSLPVMADAQLSAALVDEAVKELGQQHVVEGLNATADSFYSSQGRLGGDFDDRNDALVSDLCEAHPDLISMEMETFQMLDLARCSRGTIRAASMCIALAERYSNAFLEHTRLGQMEAAAGRVAFAALTKMELVGSGEWDEELVAANMALAAGRVNGVSPVGSAYFDSIDRLVAPEKARRADLERRAE